MKSILVTLDFYINYFFQGYKKCYFFLDYVIFDKKINGIFIFAPLNLMSFFTFCF